MVNITKTIKLLPIALSILFLALAVQPLTAATYYVDSSGGSDSNNGLTPSTAWRTIDKVNDEMDRFDPGDSILFKGGSTFSDDSLYITCQGSSGNPITFGSYGTGRPKFQSRGIRCSTGQGYITVDNFEIANPGSDGIAFYRESGWQYDITVSNCLVYGSGNVGIILLSCDGYLIENCTARGSDNGNIVIYGSDYPIKNGVIRGCAAYDAIQNDGICIHVGDNGEPCGSNHLIVSCRVHGNAEEGIDINSGHYVTILGCNAYGDDYAGMILESDHITVRRCRVHDGHHGIHIGASDVTVKSNLIYDNAGDQILIEPYRSVSGIYLYNNTIVAGANSSGIILDIDPGADNIVVKNNIFTSTQYSDPDTYVRVPSSSDARFDYNLYWRRDDNSSNRFSIGGNRSFSTWQSSFGNDIHGLWADPRFVSLSGGDFHLQADSPCRDAGTNVGVVTDFEGTSVPQGSAPDIGAYEYNGGAPPPPPSFQADAHASRTSGEVPLDVSFQGSASGGTTPYSYRWTFGDGDSSTAQNPTHTYSETGTFTATLTVTDSQNQTDSDSVTIRVYPASASPLDAVLAASRTSGPAPLSVKFTASATGGTTPYSYSYNFGDGGSSTAQNPSHTFTSSGTFVVTLTVTDSHNSKVVKTITIKVNEANLPADFECVPQKLFFGATSSGDKTSSQEFSILDKALGLLNWKSTTNRKWLFCSPSTGTGSEKITVRIDPAGMHTGYYQGSVIIYAPNAKVSPRYVTIALNVYEQDFSPIGAIDSPQEGAVVSGNFPISGWALDDIQVTKVTIKRSVHPDDIADNIGPDGLIELGDAFFCEGARRDIPENYPDYPMARFAGWGYVLQTYQWPNKGNGSFAIHAIATDSSGQTTELGTRTIIGNNAGRTLPFGSIDAPGYGEQVSGEDYSSTGWVLAHPPHSIPEDGSTIWVWMDGLRLGNPVYNQYREDIASLFPEYLNSQGAGGSFPFSPKQFSDGVHSLLWSATDSDGQSDAVDSRYFSIHNPDFPPSPLTYLELKNIYEQDTSGSMKCDVDQVRMGYTLDVDPDIRLDEQGNIEVQLHEMEPVELRFKTNSGGPVTFFGWGEKEWESLPLGTTLKHEEGIFGWIPSPGFLGTFVFHFAYTDGTTISKPIQLRVQILAKAPEPEKKKQKKINR